MITLDNIFSHEIVGLRATISNSVNSEIIGLNGTIVDETKSMFTIKTGKRFKNIPKKHNTWKFFIDDQEMTLSGSILEKRSFDRLRSKI
jgi:ribonuclease P protein subunit POP4